MLIYFFIKFKYYINETSNPSSTNVSSKIFTNKIKHKKYSNTGKYTPINPLLNINSTHPFIKPINIIGLKSSYFIYIRLFEVLRMYKNTKINQRYIDK